MDKGNEATMDKGNEATMDKGNEATSKFYIQYSIFSIRYSIFFKDGAGRFPLLNWVT
jgi:hypothetical protein